MTVLERSRGGLTGRGAGIGTPTPAFETLVKRDLVSDAIPRSTASDHPLTSRDASLSPLGHTALTLPLDMVLLNWGDLWSELRSRVDDTTYLEGHRVEAVEHGESSVTVFVANGWSGAFDLVLFADGYKSLGRVLLFPDAEPSYRGYVLWRGVLSEDRVSDSGPLESALYRLHYKGLAGNAVFYLVPGASGSTQAGERWVNWACYVPVASEDLAGFLVDRTGRRHEHSLPPGSMRVEEEQRLGELLAALGAQMERAFVWEAPDFSEMTESEARDWWTTSISFPDEFSYVGQDDD